MGRHGRGHPGAADQARALSRCTGQRRPRTMVAGRMTAISQTMRTSRELAALIDLSARIGSDPLLIQGPGGNTSVKEEGLLWIKASGTWLSQAKARPIMVPVRLEPLLQAIGRNDPTCENAVEFVPADLNPQGLRPSIETTLH